MRLAAFAIKRTALLCTALAAAASLGEAARPGPGEMAVSNQAAEQTAPAFAPFLIRGVRFEGTDVPAAVADAARPYIGRIATKAVIADLADAMTAAYKKSDVAFFTVAIPNQSFDNGVVRVLAAEGRIDKIRLVGETKGRKHTMVTAYAERLQTPEPLSRARLERTLSLARDIPGVTVEPVLRYGDGPGELNVDMKLDYKRPTLSFGFTNRTTRLVDDGQVTATGKAYRLLRDGDMTTLRLGAAVNFKDSLQASLVHSTPLGHNGVRAEASVAALRTRPNGTDIKGDAELYGVAISAPLIRSYKRNMILRAGLDAVNSDNAAFGSLVATERTRAARLSIAYSDIRERTTYRVTLAGAQGIDFANADVTPAIGDENYFKLESDVAASRRFGDDFFLRLKAAGQWTEDALPANERFSIGGANFGRAFDASLINADRGFSLLVEPAFRPIDGGAFSKSEIYAFADYAQADVFSRSSGADATLDLGSYGAGLRAAYKDNGVLEVEVARPYDQPVPGYDQGWRFSIGWRLDWRP